MDGTGSELYCLKWLAVQDKESKAAREEEEEDQEWFHQLYLLSKSHARVTSTAKKRGGEREKRDNENKGKQGGFFVRETESGKRPQKSSFFFPDKLITISFR